MEAQAEASQVEITKNPQRPPPARRKFPQEHDTGSWAACKPVGATQEAEVYGDSALVINQLNKDWNCTNKKMDAYCTAIRKLEDKFYGIEYHHVGYEDIEEKPPIEPLVATVPGPSSDWREPFIKYLTIADVPADNTEREHLTQHNKHYILVEGKLYHKNAKVELLHKCISVEDVADVEAFVRWPLKPMLGGFCWVYVCIDKFSKWIEYKPLVQATAKKVAELLDHIIHRANGQVERANGMILDALKKRLYMNKQKHSGKWLKEFLAMVWGLRT
ncbi:uncharacterized protein [Miscanthus floridulus]|uniref:uncharacterized protein n=1 Tax=Miscanthus floridulus TaxID=154761 RepID=UPI00345A655F